MNIKTIGVKKLKDNLSLYLKEANSGAIILITDRDRVIAELHRPVLDIYAHAEKSILADWIREGKIIPPRTEKKKCPESSIKVGKTASSILIDQERGE